MLLHKIYKKGKLGLSIIEMMLSFLLLSMLMGLVCYILVAGTSAWMKSRRQVDMKQSSLISFIWLEKELRGSDAKSVEIINYPTTTTNSAISFLSGYDTLSGTIDYDYTNNKINWKRYILYYLDLDREIPPGESQYYPSGLKVYNLMRREVTLENYSPADSYTTKTLAHLYYPPDGSLYPASDTRAMLNYITAADDTYTFKARTISKNITVLQFSISIDKVEVHIKSQTPNGPDTTEINNNIYIRNNN